MNFNDLPPIEDSPESFHLQPNLEWGNFFGGGGDSGGGGMAAARQGAPDCSPAAAMDGQSEMAPVFAAPSFPAGSPPPSTKDYSEQLRPLFYDIARHHCETLPALVVEIQRGEAPEETFQALLGLFEKLLASALEVEFEDLANDLAAVVERLGAMAEDNTPDPRNIAEFIRRYRLLAVNFPEIFLQHDNEAADQFIAESIIVVEELRAIRGLGKMRSRYLFAAGINRLSIFCEASRRDLEAVSGMNAALAERLAASFEPYKPMVQRDEKAIALLRQKALKDLAFQLMDLEECDRELEQVHERNRFRILDVSPEEAQLQRIRQRYYGAICKHLAILGRIHDIDALGAKRFRDRIAGLWTILEKIESNA